MSKRKKEEESVESESGESESGDESGEDESEEEEEEEKKPQKKKVVKKATKPKPKKKRRKDPNAPKKPTTAYAFFLKAKKNEFQTQYPDLKYPEITKKISTAWRALDNDAKKEFMELYEQDKVRYHKAMENYKKPSSESEESSDEEEDSKKKKKKKKKKVVKKRDPLAPKQATNAYMYFQKDKRDEIKKENPSLKTLPQVAKKMGEIWGKMTDDDKKPYLEMATKDKQRYEKEIKDYKEKQVEKEKKEKEDKEKEKKAKAKAKKEEEEEDDSEDDNDDDDDDEEDDD